MAGAFISDNTVIVLITGTLSIAALGYYMYVVQVSKAVDSNVKRMNLVSLFVMVAILMRMLSKLGWVSF